MKYKTNIMEKIEEIYNEIRILDKLDNCNLSEATCKLAEEFGELVREINKTTGRKTTNESYDMVISNIEEEIADTLQNLLLISSRFNISIDNILDRLSSKNKKWENIIINKV